MGKSAQAKGRRGERELSAKLNEYGFQTEPGPPLSFGRVADVTGLPGIHIEVKRHECPDVTAALRQAAEDAQHFGDGLPTVFWRKNRGRWVAVMDLETFVKLYKRGHGGTFQE